MRPDPAEVMVETFFTYTHLPEELAEISSDCHTLAVSMLAALPPGPERTAGMRKLLEAKDCFVRARVAELYSHEADIGG